MSAHQIAGALTALLVFGVFALVVYAATRPDGVDMMYGVRAPIVWRLQTLLGLKKDAVADLLTVSRTANPAIFDSNDGLAIMTLLHTDVKITAQDAENLLEQRRSTWQSEHPDYKIATREFVSGFV